MKTKVFAGIFPLLALMACGEHSRNGTMMSQDFLRDSPLGGVLRINPESDPTGGNPMAPDDNGISFHGGPVMDTIAARPTHLYYIWYGNWTGHPALTILTDFANTLGGSAYFEVNTTYCDTFDCSTGGNPVRNVIQFNGAAFDSYSQGTNLTNLGVQLVVSGAINRGDLPRDADGVYTVLTSQDVSQNGTQFCGVYCGWHTHANLGGTDIKYGFIGNPLHCSGTQCTRQRTVSPNGDPAADGMANIIGHEVEESVTDPDLNAWFRTSDGEENADLCAWTFGATYTVPNGSLANMQLGTRDFYIQQNWVNKEGGFCAKSLVPIVSNFTPASGHPGDSVNITGHLFENVQSVNIAGANCTFTVTDSQHMVATLPGDASPAVGPIRVVSSEGEGDSTSNYTILGPPPQVLSFAPTSGHPGDTVDINGTNFVGLSGPNAVRFNGINAARYTVISDMEVTAVVPSGGGVTGPISITTQTGGTGSSSDSFTILGRFTATANLGTGRANHTATLLTSGLDAGKVLIAGGNLSGVSLTSAELYDPTAGTFASTGDMNLARAYHTASLLSDGTVLIVGGGDDSSSLDSAEIYDPNAETFTLVPGTALSSPRRGHTATVLGNGQVLIAGGLADATISLSSADLYDPVASTFSQTGDMTLARHFHTATALQDGRVLMVGGPGTTAGTAGRTGELYSGGSFSGAGDFADPRMNHTAVLLGDGRALIGGLVGVGTSAMYYDPVAGTFTTFNAPGNGGNRHAATILPSGVVLWTGGSTSPASSRLHLPATGETYFSGNMTHGRNSHSSTLLPDGRVLLVGGVGVSANTAEVYDFNSP
jgi:hypothetical protein